MSVLAHMRDPDAPVPDIADVEAAVHHLINGRDLDGHQYSKVDLDRVHYPKDGGKTWTLRECLAETAEELIWFYELDRKRVPKPSEHKCLACGRPSGADDMCPRCADDDARTAAADRPAPFSPGSPNG